MTFKSARCRQIAFSSFHLFFILLFGLTLPMTAQKYQLVWSDEFDGNEVDTSKWDFQIGDACELVMGCGWGNNELQYYRKENATVSNGNLVITAKEESFGGLNYTSTRMRTFGKQDWTYGRFEMRAILPEGQGIWPAFWLLFSDETYGGWAASGEIDIMEMTGDHPEKIFGTIHYGGEYPANVWNGKDFTLKNGSFAEDYHIFAVEWEYGEIRWYVDDVHYATQTDWYSTGAPYPAPFNHDMYLILNIAVGGNLPGSPDATTSFPQTMTVDYVRVYQMLDNEAPKLAITAPAKGAKFNAGDNLTIKADVIDEPGTIRKVEFFQGEAKLAETRKAPYQFEIKDVAAGSYEINVKATDNQGAIATDKVNITVGKEQQSPYKMKAAAIPGIVEAEHFDLGGEDIAWFDSDPATQRSEGYRGDTGVDIERNSDFDLGFNVTDTRAGEWLEYQVNIAQSGTYLIDLRIASDNDDGIAHIKFDGADKTGPIAITNTDSLQNWATVRTRALKLDAGIQTMRLAIDKGGFNINSIEIEIDAPTGNDQVHLFEDFEDDDLSGWRYFPGSEGASVKGRTAGKLPVNGDRYFAVLAEGAGSASKFYGGGYINLNNSDQVNIPWEPWINLWVNISSASTVDRFSLELTFREDRDGNGWTNGREDSRKLVLPFAKAQFKDEWMLISKPLSDLIDVGTGGNGYLEGKLDEFVIVVADVEGENPSKLRFAMDEITFSSGGTPERFLKKHEMRLKK